MKSSWTRKLGLLLALSCAVVQPALESPLVASALTLGIYSIHPHAHSLGVHVDGNHLDLVFSHGEAHHDDHGELPADHDHPVSLSGADHVVHITGSEPSSTTPRRAILDRAPMLALRAAPPIVAAPIWVSRSMQEPRARGVELLRTVVLLV